MELNQFLTVDSWSSVVYSWYSVLFFFLMMHQLKMDRSQFVFFNHSICFVAQKQKMVNEFCSVRFSAEIVNVLTFLSILRKWPVSNACTKYWPKTSSLSVTVNLWLSHHCFASRSFIHETQQISNEAKKKRPIQLNFVQFFSIQYASDFNKFVVINQNSRLVFKNRWPKEC